MTCIYLGLGSNRGDRSGNLQRAVAALPAAGVRPRRLSPVYETGPTGMKGRAWFLNQVVEADTDLLPRQLMRRLLALERALGRHRFGRGGPATPRSLDLDLLLYGGLRLTSPELNVPHPRLTARRFMLAPLADISPSLRLPPDAGRVARHLRQAHRLPMHRLA